MSALPSSVRFGVDQRLTRELPRFFGGLSACFRELFQNSFRGGALNVCIEVCEKSKTITFSDDSVGCDDPLLVVRGGATGWDETKVTEPAGLGIFSFLNKELFTKVAITSKNWSIVVNTSDWVDRDIEVIHRETFQAGFTVQLTVTDFKSVTANWNGDLSARFTSLVRGSRDLYPYNVHLTVQRTDTEEVAQPRLIEKKYPSTVLMSVDTPIGRLHLLELDSYRSDYPVPTWDYRYLRGLRSRLKGHARLTPDLDDFVWEVDHASGVRPKLPDRTELIDGPQLDADLQIARKAIYESVMEYITTRYSKAIAALPDLITGNPTSPKPNNDDVKTPIHAWVVQHWHAIVAELGWRSYSTDDVESYSYYYVHDQGIEHNVEEHVIWLKGGHPAEESVISALFNQPGMMDAIKAQGTAHPVIQLLRDKEKAKADIQADVVPPTEKVDPKDFKTQSPYLMIARSITWNDLPLEFYYSYDHTPDLVPSDVPDPWVITSLDPRTIQFEDVINGQAFTSAHPLMDVIVHHGITKDDSCYDWEDNNGDDVTVADEAVVADVYEQLSQYYGVPIIKQKKEAGEYGGLLSALQLVTDTLGTVKEKLKKDQDWKIATRHATALLSRIKKEHAGREVKYRNALRTLFTHLNELRDPDAKKPKGKRSRTRATQVDQ